MLNSISLTVRYNDRPISIFVDHIIYVTPIDNEETCSFIRLVGGAGIDVKQSHKDIMHMIEEIKIAQRI